MTSKHHHLRQTLRNCCLAAAAFALALPPALADTAFKLPPPRPADFGKQAASHEVRLLANWVLASRDNRSMPFVILDKRLARLYVFDSGGLLRGATPVLLGRARGDDSVPGIGERKMEDIEVFERTTPSGRFVGQPGRNVDGEDIVWVDYDAAVSMHRLRAIDPKERRFQRLASRTPFDNRISYGCINVPAAFYDAFVSPLFAAHRAVVYVLPETRGLRNLFTPPDTARAATHVTRPGARGVTALGLVPLSKL
jgi:hypothetical protein